MIFIIIIVIYLIVAYLFSSAGINMIDAGHEILTFLVLIMIGLLISISLKLTKILKKLYPEDYIVPEESDEYAKYDESGFNVEHKENDESNKKKE